jgi:hypothetical protein
MTPNQILKQGYATEDHELPAFMEKIGSISFPAHAEERSTLVRTRTSLLP